MANTILSILIPLLTAFIGAVLAFRYQRTIELKRDKRAVIQTLMVYRNVGALELEWVKALNAVDVVFHSDKKVIETYHTLLAQLRPPLFHNGQWVETFYLLIYQMARCSDYGNLSLREIRDYYAPMALDDHYPLSNVSRLPQAPNSNDLPAVSGGE